MNLWFDAVAIILAIVLSYSVFLYQKKRLEIEKKKAKGDAKAYALDVAGKLATGFTSDLKDSTEKGTKKKQEVQTKIKTTLADSGIPVPSDAVLSGIIEKAVQTMKIADKKEDDKNA